MKLFTIGFTKKTAEQFFEGLRRAGVKRVVDVRLNNVSQLAGFSKKEDLKYLLRMIAGIDYIHLPSLAPTKPMLSNYQSRVINWPTYAGQFTQLITERQVERSLRPEDVKDDCLLCSEHLPHHCHRRLVAEYLQRQWPHTTIEHIQ